MFARRPVFAIGDSEVKYESADSVEGGAMVLPTSPKTLARQRMRVLRDGFIRVPVQSGYPLMGKSEVSPDVYASMRGSAVNGEAP
jgi:hypothetical protein